MDAADEVPGGKSVWDLLLGLQLGVIGGLLMLAWTALVSPIVGHPWWLIPNLMASHFYTPRELYFGPGVVTLVGAAVQVFTSGLVGSMTGIVTPGGRLSGIAMAIAWYLFCLLFLWKRMAPMMLLTPVQPILWTGYFIFGSTLGWHRHLRSRIHHAFRDTA
jgi:hypothetical protein